jgi:hypothetical protein
MFCLKYEKKSAELPISKHLSALQGVTGISTNSINFPVKGEAIEL